MKTMLKKRRSISDTFKHYIISIIQIIVQLKRAIKRINFFFLIHATQASIETKIFTSFNIPTIIIYINPTLLIIKVMECCSQGSKILTQSPIRFKTTFITG